MRSGEHLFAVVVALAAHAGLAFVVARVPPISRSAHVMADWDVGEISVVRDEEDRAETGASPPLSPLITAPIPASAGVAAASSPRLHAAGSANLAAPSTTESATVQDGISLGTNAQMASPAIDLGVGTYWKSVASGPGSLAASATHSEASSPATSVDRFFRAERDARDRSLGLGAGGPLVTAAHQALSLPTAPDVGSATLDFDCDAGGQVVAATILPPVTVAWEDVRREILRLMAKRTVHVPSGSRGARVRLSIVAERVSPTGKVKPAWTPGALPDDVAGGDADSSVCQGEGSSRKCTSGMIVGATVTGADVVNLTANAVRVVRVKILGETTL